MSLNKILQGKVEVGFYNYLKVFPVGSNSAASGKQNKGTDILLSTYKKKPTQTVIIIIIIIIINHYYMIQYIHSAKIIYIIILKNN